MEDPLYVGPAGASAKISACMYKYCLKICYTPRPLDDAFKSTDFNALENRNSIILMTSWFESNPGH